MLRQDASGKVRLARRSHVAVAKTRIIEATTRIKMLVKGFNVPKIKNTMIDNAVPGEGETGLRALASRDDFLQD